ncbi:Retinoblastoma-associated protein [Hondaea fermentalgiana]|uniref:Retinoblastoma-associated protein n=1 Tax=Hondaea fermentalgiana TaxID=2315210 RepID=A0A2R5G9A3_9STRA|nr:Retinoblastoma-associated protein [Hondaea fermentalgiana]|eukprot:GBG27600.1 Retinoblastoma-associated protein [Hondaea fermentalgiana]
MLFFIGHDEGFSLRFVLQSLHGFTHLHIFIIVIILLDILIAAAAEKEQQQAQEHGQEDAEGAYAEATMEDAEARVEQTCADLGLDAVAARRASALLRRICEEKDLAGADLDAWRASVVFVVAARLLEGEEVRAAQQGKGDGAHGNDDAAPGEETARKRQKRLDGTAGGFTAPQEALKRIHLRKIGLENILRAHHDATEFGETFVDQVHTAARVEGGIQEESLKALEDSLKAHKQLGLLYQKFVVICRDQDPLPVSRRALAWYLFLVGRRLLAHDQDMAWSYELLLDAVSHVRQDKASSDRMKGLVDQLTKLGVNPTDAMDVGRHYEIAYLQDMASLDERSFLKHENVACIPAQTPLKERRAPRAGENPADAPGSASSDAQPENNHMPPPVQARTRFKRKAEEMAAVRTLLPSKTLFSGDAEEGAPREVFFDKSTAPQVSSPRNASMARRAPFRRPAETPVSLAVETSNWLNRELDGASESPEATLLRFFAECEEAHNQQREQRSVSELPQDEAENEQPVTLVQAFGFLASDTEARLREMRAALLQDGTEDGPQPHISKELFHGTHAAGQGAACSSSSSVAAIKKHTAAGTKLYYRVLESILQGEAIRLRVADVDSRASKGNLYSLLKSDMFHRGLFACCMEVIFRAKEIFRLMHPTLTDRLGVPGLELLKVLESFMKYVPMLPKMLVQHMHMLETDILEEHVWRKGSPIFDLLHERKRVVEIERTDIATVPKLHRLDEFFTQKLLAHAHAKAKKIFMRLGYPQNDTGFYKDIWRVFREAIKHHPELCEDRHLDSVILCSIFAVSKLRAVEPALTFKRLVAVYKESRVENADTYAALISNMSRFRTQNLARTDKVVDRIYMPNNANKRTTRSGAYNHTGTIVDFYNQMFLPRMKPTILNLRAPAGAGVGPGV